MAEPTYLGDGERILFGASPTGSRESDWAEASLREPSKEAHARFERALLAPVAKLFLLLAASAEINVWRLRPHESAAVSHEQPDRRKPRTKSLSNGHVGAM